MNKRITDTLERDSTVNTNSIIEIQGAIDWVTLTGTNFNAWEKVQDMALSIHGELENQGFKEYYQTRHGFRMKSITGIQFGKGYNGWMVVLTGGIAAKFWMPFAAYATNITRIDLQATIWYNSDCEEFIWGLWEKALADLPKRERDKMTLIDGGKRGDTLYFGSRASQQFGRVYDKQRQSGNDPNWQNAIRYEVEYKKPLSGEVMRWMLDKDPTQEEIVARVFDWFTARGIHVPEISTVPISAIQSPRKETPIENKLAWLRKTVRPVYRQLVMLGYQVDADGAIGTSDDAITLDKIEE